MGNTVRGMNDAIEYRERWHHLIVHVHAQALAIDLEVYFSIFETLTKKVEIPKSQFILVC